MRSGIGCVAAVLILATLVACGADPTQQAPPGEAVKTENVTIATPVASAGAQPTVKPGVGTAVPTPAPQPTLPIFNPLAPPRPDDVAVEHIVRFDQLPDNRARGQEAPDFSARLMGGGTFRLSEARGRYWLVLPTAMGCGECMFSLGMITEAQPEETSNLNVLVLDIYEPDQPEYWTTYLGYFEGLEALWGVVNGGNFLVDYEIYGLGTFLVIDPEGRLVFHSDSTPRLEYITHMFTLANRQGVE